MIVEAIKAFWRHERAVRAIGKLKIKPASEEQILRAAQWAAEHGWSPYMTIDEPKDMNPTAYREWSERRLKPSAGSVMEMSIGYDIRQHCFCAICGLMALSGQVDMQRPVLRDYCHSNEPFEPTKRCIIVKFTCANGHKSELRSQET